MHTGAPSMRRSHDPPTLTALQALIGAAGTAAAWGSWAGTRWAAAAALLHGLVTAVMLAALTPLLDLDPDSSGGLLFGAAMVLLFGAGAAWYLRRDTGRATRTRGTVG